MPLFKPGEGLVPLLSCLRSIKEMFSFMFLNVNFIIFTRQIRV